MKYINKSVCRGVAGRRARGWKPLGIVIHNDGGSMTPEAYVEWLAAKTPKQLQAGFAHYYGNRNTMARVEDTYNGAWHVANYNGNMDYVGYEVCESLKVSDKDFIANEEAVFQQAAKDMKDWGLTPSRTTVKLHRAFVPTDCPHRSWALHVGRGAADTTANRNKLVDYFVSRIKHYMEGGNNSVSKSTYYNKTGWYKVLRDDTFYTSKDFSEKTRSKWKLAKGSVFCVDEIVKNSSGVATRGVVMAIGKAGKRYFTLNKDIVEKL